VFSSLTHKFFMLLIFVCAFAFQLTTASAQQSPAPSQPAPAPLQQTAPPKDSPLSFSPSSSVFATANDADYREDFSTLTLKGSAFFPLTPVLGQTDDDPKMPFIRERWQMMWRPADSFDLYVCKPRGISGKLPVILYLYTYPGSTDRFKSDDWCMTMTSEGFAAIGFLSAYTGARLEMRSPIATFFTDFQESLASTVHDIPFILDYLATRDDLDMTRVGMYGQGSGGTIAILASSVDKRIRAINVLTPWGDWPNFFSQTRYVAADKRAKFMAPEFQTKIAPFDPVKVLPKVQARSVRIDDVRKSGPMPDSSQEHLEAAAPSTAIINQYGDPAALVPHASAGEQFAWLKTELQSKAKPKVSLVKGERIHFYPPANVNPLPPLVPLADLQKQDRQKRAQQPTQKP
jgi:hypothetical protein